MITTLEHDGTTFLVDDVVYVEHKHDCKTTGLIKNFFDECFTVKTCNITSIKINYKDIESMEVIK